MIPDYEDHSIAFCICPASIADSEIAAVIDRHIPVVLEYALGPTDLNNAGCINGLLSAAQAFVSQYQDRFSQHYNSSHILEMACSALDRVLSGGWENVGRYEAGFVAWCLFDCMQACSGTLPDHYMDEIRSKFEHLAKILLNNAWDFMRDTRVNCDVVQSAGLAVAGWALGDESLLQASRERMAVIVRDHCDENAVPSEISLAYLPQMVTWAALATEVADMPDNISLIRGISSVASLFLNKDTFELMGPDCRETWKAVDRYAMDAWLIALKTAAVVCNDGQCEWLARSLFRRWQYNAQPGLSAYSARAPRYLGCEQLGFGYGAANSPELAATRAVYMCGVLSALKRWNKKEIVPQPPVWLQSYRSSKLSIMRHERGRDVIIIGNVQNPVSYFTDQFCLHGFELWADDPVFWLLGSEFLPMHESEGAISFRQQLGPQGEHTSTTLKDHIVRSVKLIDGHVALLIQIDCSAQLPPGMEAYGGMLLSYDRSGRIWFNRDNYTEEGAFADEHYGCDWILYPCGPKRHFGFGLLHFSTSSNGRKLCNLGGGDWCTLEFRNTEEPISGLKAMAVLLIGPWDGSSKEYDEWLSEWTCNISYKEMILTSPCGERYNIPIYDRD